MNSDSLNIRFIFPSSLLYVLFFICSIMRYDMSMPQGRVTADDNEYNYMVVFTT